MITLQLASNFTLFFISIFGLISNRKNLLVTIMCLELLLLSANLNFLCFSVYLDDMYGQLFSLMILTVVASESAIGLALIITYYRTRGSILYTNKTVLRY